VLFSTPYTLGGHPFLQEVQTATPDAYCLNAQGQHVACVENRRWTVGRVTYATLNIQGSCNNLCDTNPDPTEYAARNAANIAWMQETFTSAKEKGSIADCAREQDRSPGAVAACAQSKRPRARLTGADFFQELWWGSKALRQLRGCTGA